MNRINTGAKKVDSHLSTYALALFLLLTPFEYPLADLMATSPLRIVGLITMGLAAVDILTQRTLKNDYRFLFIVLWLLYGFASFFWAIDEVRFQSYYSIYLNNALMFLLISLVSYTKREANILKKSMVLGVGALLLYMSFVPGAVTYSEYQKRLTLNAGTEGLDQNYLAALMLIAFGLVFYNFCNKRQNIFVKILSLAYCLTITYYVLLTGSRSGLMAILLIVLLSINTSWKTFFTVGIPVILFVVCILPLITQYLPEELMMRFSQEAFSGQEEESGSRLIIWEKALNSMKDFSWLFGFGVGASQTIVGDVLGSGKDMAIHNHYIAMLVEVGVVGFLLVNVPILKMLNSLRKKDKAMSFAFIGIMLMAVFLDVLTTKFFWSAMMLLSACCSACNHINGDERIEK